MSDRKVGRHVAVGVDGSLSAARAAAWAAAEAAARGVSLQLVHAQGEPHAAGAVMPFPYEDDGQRAEAADRLFAGALAPIRQAHPNLPITTAFAKNTPTGTLVAASRTAELLVVGDRGLGGFTHLMVGSVSLRVAAHTHCPTVVVRGDPGHDDGRADIVLGVEEDEPEPPVTFAFEAARRAHAGVRAVHVWQPGTADIDLLDQVDEADIFDDVLGPSHRSLPDVTCRLEIAEGGIVKQLLDAAEGARLLVVGSHRRHGHLSPGLGLVVHGLLHHAPCPVAVVPTV